MNENELYYMYHMGSDDALYLLTKLYQREIMVMVKHHYLSGFSEVDMIDFQQVAHLQLVNALHTYREEMGVPLLNYFLKILKYKYINFKRSLFRYGKEAERIAVSLDQVISEDNPTYLEEYIPNLQPDIQADYLLEKHYLDDKLYEILQDLTDVEKQIFLLRKEGYRYREISQVLEISQKKVDNTLAKIRKAKYSFEN